MTLDKIIYEVNTDFQVQGNRGTARQFKSGDSFWAEPTNGGVIYTHETTEKFLIPAEYLVNTTEIGTDKEQITELKVWTKRITESPYFKYAVIVLI